MDILKIFRMQEPISKAQLKKTTKSTENLLQNKDVAETSAETEENKIKSLENELSLVKEEKLKLEEELKSKRDLDECDKIFRAYEVFISKLLIEMQHLKDEKRTAQQHLAKLEIGFGDLLEKYNRAKSIIEGFRINEGILKSELKRLKDVIDQLNHKYEALKEYTDSEISQANLQLNKKDEGNIKEVAKLKARILESESIIADLEKHVKYEDICTRNNMFDPLKLNIIQSKLT